MSPITRWYIRLAGVLCFITAAVIAALLFWTSMVDITFQYVVFMLVAVGLALFNPPGRYPTSNQPPPSS